MSVQYLTHVFLILICHNHARLIWWDCSGAIVTEPIKYTVVPHLFDFFIRLNHSPANVLGHDTTVKLAKPKDTKDTVKAIKELEKLQTPLLVISVPKPATGEHLEYIIMAPLASPWVSVGHWT